MIVYDTENNRTNEIKRNYIEVYMPEALTATASRYIGASYPPGLPVGDGGTGSTANVSLLNESNCVDTWEEAIFRWDEFWGRWINPIKTWTTWDDCDIEWSTLEVTPLSQENNWNFPASDVYDIYRVSAYDNLVGIVQSFTPITSTTGTIVVGSLSNINNLPETDISEIVYVRRSDLVFPLTVTSVTTGATTVTYGISGSWPAGFEANPTAWEFLREVKSTLVVKDDLYTPDNGKTLTAGEFIKIKRSNSTPINASRWNFDVLGKQELWGIPIDAQLLYGPSSLVNGISIANTYDPALFEQWVNGQIYQYRNGDAANGNLFLFQNPDVGINVVYFERLVTPTEENWGNRGMFYINDCIANGSPSPTNPVTNADPLTELVPGFSFITLIVGDPATGLEYYKQHFRVINVYADTSNQGHPWDLFSEPAESRVICVEVLTEDGKKFDEIASILANYYGNAFAWIEYRYNVFPTRTFDEVSVPPGTTDILLDFNTKTVLQEFVNSVDFPADPVTGTGWYYDHSVSEGDFSLKVTNVGEYSTPTGWTIVTVEDPDSELYRSDSTFELSEVGFDEDYAETHLGVKLGWHELENIDWNAMCSQTWNTTDWNYNLYPNFRIIPGSNNIQSFRFNEYPEFKIDLSSFAAFPTFSMAKSVAYVASVLNNNFFDPTGTVQENFNEGLSRFQYEPHSYDNSAIRTGIYTWGDPTSVILTRIDTSTLPGVNWIPYGDGIQPGWRVSAAAGNSVTLTSVVNESVGVRPWIPICRFHCTTKTGSRKLTNIVGYDANLPRGGYIYDPVGNTLIGEFGSGIGPVRIDDGFVTEITMDTAAASDEDNFLIEVYPHASGLIKFMNPSVGANSYYILASAKSPGADSLGYLRNGIQGDGSTGYWLNDYGYAYNTGNFVASSYPVGNYYNWVQGLEYDVSSNVLISPAYGGGLENSLLQFQQYYRNIQVYTYEGGRETLPAFITKPESTGWYPSVSWGSYNFVAGASEYDPNVSSSQSYPNYWKPVTRVSLYNQNGVAIAPIFAPPITVSPFSLVLNRDFDGQAVLFLFDGVNNLPADLTAAGGIVSPSLASGSYIKVVVNDYEGDGNSQEIEAIVVDASRGILGRAATYFEADYDEDLSLIYDYNTRQLTNLVGISTPQEPTLYTGMILGNLSIATNYFEEDSLFNTVINAYDQENGILVMSNPQVAGSGNSLDWYAYSPLNLSLKVQPTNEKLWSRTQQWNSMRLQYESAISSAFTWEDTNITIREKKIPAGTSVLFSSDASDIAGKTTFFWNLYHRVDETLTKVCSITDPNFLWTFLEEGLYDLELTITDTNGNVQRRYNTNFIEVYLAER
jgi:hypothetical protein